MEHSIYIYGALHIYMEHCICIWSTPYIYGALHIYMEHSIYIWSTPYIYGALHLYMEHSIYIWSTPYIYGALHLYMEHSIYIWSTAFVYGALHIYMEHCICIWSTPFIFGGLFIVLTQMAPHTNLKCHCNYLRLCFSSKFVVTNFTCLRIATVLTQTLYLCTIALGLAHMTLLSYIPGPVTSFMLLKLEGVGLGTRLIAIIFNRSGKTMSSYS